MAKMATLEMSSYITDFGTTISRLPFKIRTGFDDCFATEADYDVRSGRPICSQQRIFTPRYLEVTFDEKPETNAGDGDGLAERAGAKIKFPIPIGNQATITAMIAQLKLCGAACIDYVGEAWRIVPPSLANYTAGGSVKMVLPDDGEFADKRAGRIIYSPNFQASTVKAKVAYEIEPTALSTVINACVGSIDESPVCEVTAIQPRYAIARGSVDNPDNPKAVFSRKGPIASADGASILDCIKNIGDLPFVECVGYQGEVVKRIDILV